MHLSYEVPSRYNLQTNNQASSILKRLQQLKKSMHMHPQEQIEKGYESIKTNPNNQSNIKNQRLNQYLPREQYHANQEQGNEEQESYRKSLEKKLNSLFEKQKQILKNQSLRHDVKGFPLYRQTQKQLTLQDQLQRKYTDFKQQRQNNRQKTDFSNIEGRNNRAYSQFQDFRDKPASNLDTRSHKINSVIETQPRTYYGSSKDGQISQMQHKIRLLEMKYLGGYHYPQSHQNISFGIGQNQAIKKISPQNNKGQTLGRKNDGKVINQRISPEYMKRGTKLKNNQPSLSNTKIVKKKQNEKILNIQTSKTNKKYDKMPIKKYMNQIKYQQGGNQGQKLPSIDLLNEFNHLKKEFHKLLEINKTVIQKVQMSQQEKVHKKQKKNRAKQMLKQIIYRLEDIKCQMNKQHIKSKSREKYNKQAQIFNKQAEDHSKQKEYLKNQKQKQKTDSLVHRNQSNQKVKSTLKQKAIQKKKIYNKKNEQFQSSSNNPHLDSAPKAEIHPEKNQIKRQSSVKQVQNLKQLLQLQIKHREIVQKKLQIFKKDHQSI